MRGKDRHLVIDQLNVTLERLNQLKAVKTPHKGWIRAIRDALGMSGTQLAERLQVSRPRIPRLEQDELTGSVTLKTMRQTAEALDCVFVYALVPRTSLDDMIRTQAKKVAGTRLQRTSHTMLLEDQLISNSDRQREYDSMVDELVLEMPRDLWSEPR
jgi:predicted DNA-binding mobile mystery protein A